MQGYDGGESFNEAVEQLHDLLQETDCVLIGAGAGLSAAAGFDYDGKRLMLYFPDFVKRYGFSDMYSGGFYPFSSYEEYWAYWSRYIYINRYMDAPVPIYRKLLDCAQDKDYFVITTNVDHCFQKAGIEKNRLFYTQGDYGLWQCSIPCHDETYDNGGAVRKMLIDQGFVIDENGVLIPPEEGAISMSVSSELVPHCPRCGTPMMMNLRADGRFVEDAGWHVAASRYQDFCEAHSDGSILLWEIGVGYNTPSIIKYPFCMMTWQNPEATYVLVNKEDASAPLEIEDQTIEIQGDIAEVIDLLR